MYDLEESMMEEFVLSEHFKIFEADKIFVAEIRSGEKRKTEQK